MSNTSTTNAKNINIAVVDDGYTKLHQTTPRRPKKATYTKYK